MRVEHDGVYGAVASKGGAPQHPARHLGFPDHFRSFNFRMKGAKGDDTARLRSPARSTRRGGSGAAAVPPDYAEDQTKTDREIPVFRVGTCEI